MFPVNKDIKFQTCRCFFIHKKILLLSLFLFSISFIYSQNIKVQGYPPIKNFSTKDYKGQSQNWAIIQDKRGVMYFANNGGVLEYDGVNWKTIEVSNISCVRSLAIDDSGKIYIGAINEFGYLSPDSFGNLKYCSLLKLLNDTFPDFGDVWSTQVTIDGVYFQTSSYIFLWNGNNFKIWEAKKKFHKLFYINNSIFVRQKGIGLQKISGDSLCLISDDEIFKNKNLFLIPIDKNSILVVTTSNEYFLLKINELTNTSKIIQYNVNFENTLIPFTIRHSIKINNNYFSIGTKGNGIMLMNIFGEITQIINKKSGLQDESVNYQYLDEQNNLWLALDNGIARLDVNTQISFFNDKTGLEGTVESIAKFNNAIYVATNLGVYYLQKNISQNTVKNKTFSIYQPQFIKINNISKSFWSLLTFTNNNDSVLLIAENNNVLQLSKKGDLDTVLKKCSPFFLYQSNINPDRVFIGLVEGLASIYYNKGKWIDEGKIDGINEEVRNIDEDKDGNVWLATTNEELIKLRYDIKTLNHLSDIKIEKFDSSNGLPPGYCFFYENNKWSLFATDEGFYQYKNNKFIPFIFPGLVFPKGLSGIHRVAKDYYGNLWVSIYAKNIFSIGYIEKTTGQKYLWNSSQFTSISKEIINAMYHENDGITWLGGPEGLFSYDSNIKKNYKSSYNVLIRKVTIGNDSIIFYGTFCNASSVVSNVQTENFKSKIKYKYNTLSFEFAAQFYEYEQDVRYSYFLKGYDNNWSNWATSSKKEYTNLDEGLYCFMVKAKNVYGNESQTAMYEFTILPPWYRTILAYIAYVVLFVLALYIGISLNSRRLRALNLRLEKIIRARTAEIRKQRDEIETQRNTVTKQKEHIEEIHKEVTDSINYAKRIQEAVLPVSTAARSILGEHFILFKPKDIVSGDFYWATRVNEWLIVTVADCTGHGVPGAFMSMLGISFLNEIVRKQEVTQANRVLNELRKEVINALQQKGKTGEQKDGMDISMLVVNTETNECQWAGANNPLYIVSSTQSAVGSRQSAVSIGTEDCGLKTEDCGLIEIKGDKMPIAIYERMDEFTNHEIQLQKSDTIYLMSDGYEDQFGGPHNKKFKSKQLKELLLSNCTQPMSEQKEILEKAINEWIGTGEQIDDITILGLKV